MPVSIGGLVAPHPVHQLVAREDQARVAGEEPEQVELLGRQLQRPSVAGDLAGAGVDHEGSGLDAPRARTPGGAPQHRPHPRHELTRGEGLGDVVVGAQIEAHDPVGLLPPGGEHDHRDLGSRPDPAAQLQAVDARQHHVEHHQLGLGALDQVAGGDAVAGLEGAVPLAAQVGGDDLAHDRLVVDDQDSRDRSLRAGGGLLHRVRLRAHRPMMTCRPCGSVTRHHQGRRSPPGTTRRRRSARARPCAVPARDRGLIPAAARRSAPRTPRAGARAPA